MIDDTKIWNFRMNLRIKKKRNYLGEKSGRVSCCVMVMSPFFLKRSKWIDLILDDCSFSLMTNRSGILFFCG